MSTAIQLRIDYLRQYGVPFQTMNSGQHLIIDTLAGKIDYWPSTNKWQVRNGRGGTGAVELLNCINGLNNPVPVAVVTPQVDPRDARIKELERVLHVVYVNNELSIGDNELIERTLPDIEKLTAEAHNINSSLPWEE